MGVFFGVDDASALSVKAKATNRCGSFLANGFNE